MDPDDRALLSAIAEARRLNAGAPIEVEMADARALDLAANSFDVGVCIGSTHALGSLAATLEELSRLVRPGGRVVIGEGYWKQDPPQDGLDAFGMAEAHVMRDSWLSWRRDAMGFALVVADVEVTHPG